MAKDSTAKFLCQEHISTIYHQTAPTPYHGENGLIPNESKELFSVFIGDQSVGSS